MLRCSDDAAYGDARDRRPRRRPAPAAPDELLPRPRRRARPRVGDPLRRRRPRHRLALAAASRAIACTAGVRSAAATRSAARRETCCSSPAASASRRLSGSPTTPSRDGLNVTMIVGARDAAHVFPSRLLPPEVEVVVTTDDGSAGRKGFVTEPFAELLEWCDQAFACGPTPMFRAMAEASRELEDAPLRAGAARRAHGLRHRHLLRLRRRGARARRPRDEARMQGRPAVRNQGCLLTESAVAVPRLHLSVPRSGGILDGRISEANAKETARAEEFSWPTPS